MRKLILAIAILALLGGGAYVALGRRGATASGKTPQVTPTLPAVKAPEQITVEGKVVPVRSVTLSLPTGGIVAEVPVTEGERVAAGQVLLRLDTTQQELAVAQAEANLKAAQARLDKLLAGPDEAEIATAEAAVEAARAQVQTAEGAVAGARANLARLQAGPTAEEIAIAQREVERAKNALWGAQNQRDGICGRTGAHSPDCDAARAAVQQAEEAVRIAELRLQQLQHGPRPEEIAAAQAQLQQALGQRAAAQAEVQRAEAELERVKRGPTPKEIAVARAQVEQARAALEQAQATLAQMELRAPFAGTVASLKAKVGAWAAPGTPLVQLADLSAWRIETQDLTEINVVRVQPGDRVTLTFDAVPDLELPGRVVRIRPIGELKQGDITYTLIIEPERQDERLRWNMTATVTIHPAGGAASR